MLLGNCSAAALPDNLSNLTNISMLRVLRVISLLFAINLRTTLKTARLALKYLQRLRR
jgi:hypothetical protein